MLTNLTAQSKPPCNQLHQIDVQISTLYFSLLLSIHKFFSLIATKLGAYQPSNLRLISSTARLTAIGDRQMNGPSKLIWNKIPLRSEGGGEVT